MGAEDRRLEEARGGQVPWKKWGPYLSERQWGTVRKDYSDSGDAWSYLSHDHARSRAYRWGEDGLAGISHDHQYLCYFHGDNGASHQTGWTGILARMMHLFATTTGKQVLELGKAAAVIEVDRPGVDQTDGAAGGRVD
jgi:hypothetical protein